MNEQTDHINKFKSTFKNDELLVYRNFESKNSKIKCCAIFFKEMISEEILYESCIRPVNEASIDDINNINVVDCMVSKIINCGLVYVYNIDVDYQTILNKIQYGLTAILVNEYKAVLVVDTKGYSFRNITEPTSEVVVKGPREGFNEDIMTNISMIRRKALNEKLKFEFMSMGSVTHTKVCIAYLDGKCNEKIINEVKKRLNNINIDGVLESEYIMESIQDEPLSPFHTIGSTERPDVVVAKLLEGKVAVICDGTPFVLTMPYLFIENFQCNEDYYRNFIISSFNRLIKIISFIAAISVPAIYIALVNYHQQLIPTKLYISIAVTREGVPFPAIVELLIMLLAFEILREAGTRLPKNIGNTVSIVGALILSDAAVEARLVSAPIIIVSAITGISGYTIPSMSVSVLVMRIVLLLLSSVYGLYGYIWGIMGFVMHLMSMRSFGVNYMKFLTDRKMEDIQDTEIRIPWLYMKIKSLNKNASMNLKKLKIKKRR